MFTFILGMTIGSIVTLFYTSLMFVSKRADQTMNI